MKFRYFVKNRSQFMKPYQKLVFIVVALGALSLTSCASQKLGCPMGITKAKASHQQIVKG
jgi:hypothetical protein